MKLLITGATGFVGTEVVECALEHGHAVRTLSRRGPSAGTPALPAMVETRVGDVLDPASCRAAAEEVDAIIHLVGIISEVGRSTFENSHIHATRHMAEAAQTAGVRRFLHMSALGTRPNAVSRYHLTKWAAEEIVRGSGLDHTIFRPSLIFGPRDHFANLFARMSRWSPVLPVMGPGRARFQPVHVRSVAEAFIRALAEPGSVGRTFDLCGPDTLTLPEILDEILRAVGRKRAKLKIPLPVARIQAAFLEWACPTFLGKAPPLNRDQLRMLQEDNIGDQKTAVDLFHLKPVGFRTGVAGYLR